MLKLNMLYVVGTPIGNLDDLSLRQAKTLALSEIILTEDTRSAKILLDRIKSTFNLQVNSSQRLISYYKETEFEKLPEILNLLAEDKIISLISESGMPIISDPGHLLIKKCIERRLKFEVIPGPTAVTTALIYSGFNPQNFTFLGFPPKKESQLTQLINQLSQGVYVFYESPKRINMTLEIMNNVIPEADVVICREMTKMFEEIVRGKPKDLLGRTYKGELTVVLNLGKPDK